jgi:anti-sigma factor RsiW
LTTEHPSPDLLDHYLINDLSEVETADLERHVFACQACFSRVAARDLEVLALTKACMMLAKLEDDGTQILTVSAPEPAPKPAPPPPVGWQFQPQYAVLAATVLLTAITVSSVGSIDRIMRPKAVSLVETPRSVATIESIESLDESLWPVDQPVQPRPAPSPRRQPQVSSSPFVIQARYTKPFLPPNGDVEAPELDMTQVPPPVYAARRLDAPAALVRLPEVPKKRVRRSRRVFSALASPFKKIGGAFAVLAVGRPDPSGI